MEKRGRGRMLQRAANQQQKHSSILKDSGAKLILFPTAEGREVRGRRRGGRSLYSEDWQTPFCWN